VEKNFGEMPAEMRKMEVENIALTTALKACLAELSELMRGEKCDHSVGICYCSTFRAMDAADEAIKKAKSV